MSAAAGRASPSGEAQGEALRRFLDEGYVVFERVVPLDVVAGMRAVWEEYFAPFSRAKAGQRRLLMHVPFKPPLYDPRFVEHPAVLAIADRVLGRRYLCAYFGSETPLPGAAAQEPHFDLAFWKRLTFMNPPLAFLNRLLGSCGYYYGLQVTVPLVDSGLENAPFEIWPATNRLRGGARASRLVTMPAGSLLVRDIRNLHRGTEHRGDAARPFLSLVYLRPWVPGWRQPEIPAEVYAALPGVSRRLFRRARIGASVPDPAAWAQRAR